MRRTSAVFPRFLPILAAVALFTLLASFAFGRAAWAKGAQSSANEPQRLELGGGMPDAFFLRPRVRGLRPVIMYLHGRGGRPQEDCRKWARVVTQFGWLVCPQGPEDRGAGARGWSNNPLSGQRILDAAVTALRAKYKGRVQTRSNILIGFSEGAFVAMQVGISDPVHWNRWLILAANDQYWYGQENADKLQMAKKQLKRVYLLTGETDEVAANTRRVGELLKGAKVPVRVRIQPGLGHEIPADRMITTYRRPLLWLDAAR